LVALSMIVSCINQSSTVVLLLALVINTVCAAAALPSWIGTSRRCVMNWATNTLEARSKRRAMSGNASRVVGPRDASNSLASVLDITAGSQSQTATPEQDRPGSSQKNGVPMPGDSMQNPNGRPAPSPEPQALNHPSQ